MVNVTIQTPVPGLSVRVPRYYALPQPVVLVTRLRGREIFADSRALMARLEDLAEYSSSEPLLLSIYQGNHFVSEAGVAALETMLRTVGLTPFFRASRRRSGPERAAFTKWNWEYLSDFLGWEWHRV
ncbi:MAG: hypothetical protein H3C27_08500 [Opitutaceae bacterium]|nr:hypothetical protein [Opitutaceae bacterium]